LEDGYAFQLKREQVNLIELAEWITSEDKCCSFFHFEIEVERNRGPLWLKIRGDEGIKKFIRATFLKRPSSVVSRKYVHKVAEFWRGWSLG
jgi:hypothetical protein